MLHTLTLALLVSSAALSGSAFASCSIHNETGISFTVESGNTSNQSVSGHTQTSIAAGKIIGKSKEGKAISGTCKDGDRLIVKDDGGVPILMAQ